MSKMADNIEKAIGLLDECLSDWGHAATMVYTIMNRIKKAKELLERKDGEQE